MNILLWRIRPFLSSLGQAFSIVWQSSPSLAVWSIIVRVIQAFLPLAVLYLTKLLIDTVTEVLKAPSAEATMTRMTIILVGLAAVAVTNVMLSSAVSLISRIQAQLVTDHMHALVQAKSVEVDLEYYEDARYYDTLHWAQHEAPYQPTAILNALLQLGQDALSLLGMAAVLWWMHWGVILVLILAAIPYFFVRLRQSHRMFTWERQRTPLERKAWYVNMLLTQATAAKEIRLFDLGHRLQQWFQDIRSVLRRERIALERRWVLAGFVAQVVGVAGVFAVYSFVAFQTFHGLHTVGDLVMFFQAVQRATGFLDGFGGSFSKLYESNLLLTTLAEFLAIQSRLPKPTHPKRFPQPITQGITFDHVSLQYPQEDRVAIKDLSFSLRPGEHVAFVGANGAGKTTLVKLLCRLYDPSGGRITIDGEDLRDFAITDVRRAVSVIFQDFVKFQFSAKENITLGASSSLTDPLDLSTVIRAAKQAGIHEVIERLPKGYESMLGKLFDGGHELSIGEWQKLALARAFLRESQILILDEPTSAMDAKAEAELFARFHELAKGRIAILISHRLSTVKMVDRIYVLDEGRILESGSHEDLMQSHSTYAELFRIQSQHYK